MNARKIYTIYLKELTICFLLLFSQLVCAQLAEFKMYYEKDTSIKIEKVFTKSVEIFPFKGEVVNSLGITANVYLESDTSLARIILVGKDGTESLIYEGNDVYENSDKITLTDFSEETSILRGLSPLSIKLQLIGSRVELKSISICKVHCYKPYLC